MFKIPNICFGHWNFGNWNLFVIWILLFGILPIACKQGQQQLVKLHGNTMGTIYNISYIDSTQRNFQQEVDSILIDINNSLSTYIDSSIISLFNKSKHDTIRRFDKHFVLVYDQAKSVYQTTNGLFDPTVMPLVNYWGFGYTRQNNFQVGATLAVAPLANRARVNRAPTKDTIVIDSLLQFVGFDRVVKFHSLKSYFVKINSKMQLDFSAIAKGYGVDVLGEFLEGKNINNYMVEIGGGGEM